jgi:hypothetical protein
MKTYTFIIGSMDDFEGIEDLMDYVEQEGLTGNLNYSVHEFEAPKECDPSTVQLIGYGIAFENDWSMCGTYSFFLDGALDGPAEKDMFNRGVEARLNLGQCSEL